MGWREEQAKIKQKIAERDSGYTIKKKSGEVIKVSGRTSSSSSSKPSTSQTTSSKPEVKPSTIQQPTQEDYRLKRIGNVTYIEKDGKKYGITQDAYDQGKASEIIKSYEDRAKQKTATPVSASSILYTSKSTDRPVVQQTSGGTVVKPKAVVDRGQNIRDIAGEGQAILLSTPGGSGTVYDSSGAEKKVSADEVRRLSGSPNLGFSSMYDDEKDMQSSSIEQGFSTYGTDPSRQPEVIPAQKIPVSSGIGTQDASTISQFNLKMKSYLDTPSLFRDPTKRKELELERSKLITTLGSKYPGVKSQDYLSTFDSQTQQLGGMSAIASQSMGMSNMDNVTLPTFNQSALNVESGTNIKEKIGIGQSKTVLTEGGFLAPDWADQKSWDQTMEKQELAKDVAIKDYVDMKDFVHDVKNLEKIQQDAGLTKQVFWSDNRAIGKATTDVAGLAKSHMEERTDRSKTLVDDASKKIKLMEEKIEANNKKSAELLKDIQQIDSRITTYNTKDADVKGARTNLGTAHTNYKSAEQLFLEKNKEYEDAGRPQEMYEDVKAYERNRDVASDTYNNLLKHYDTTLDYSNKENELVGLYTDVTKAQTLRKQKEAELDRIFKDSKFIENKSLALGDDVKEQLRILGDQQEHLSYIANREIGEILDTDKLKYKQREFKEATAHEDMPWYGKVEGFVGSVGLGALGSARGVGKFAVVNPAREIAKDVEKKGLLNTTVSVLTPYDPSTGKINPLNIVPGTGTSKYWAKGIYDPTREKGNRLDSEAAWGAVDLALITVSAWGKPVGAGAKAVASPIGKVAAKVAPKSAAWLASPGGRAVTSTGLKNIGKVATYVGIPALIAAPEVKQILAGEETLGGAAADIGKTLGRMGFVSSAAATVAAPHNIPIQFKKFQVAGPGGKASTVHYGAEWHIPGTTKGGGLLGYTKTPYYITKTGKHVPYLLDKSGKMIASGSKVPTWRVTAGNPRVALRSGMPQSVTIKGVTHYAPPGAKSFKIGKKTYNIGKDMTVKVGGEKVFLDSPGYLPTSTAQYKMFMKSGRQIYTPTQLKAYGMQRAAETNLYKISGQQPDQFLPEQLQSMNPTGARDMYAMFRKPGNFYGSAVIKMQVKPALWKQYRGQKLPADLDISLPGATQKTAEKMAKAAANKLKASGHTVRIQKSTPTMVETKVLNPETGKYVWKHAVDVHAGTPPIEQLGSLEFASTQSRGVPLLGRTYKAAGGEKVMTLGEGTVRKGTSAFTTRATPQGIGFSPQAHRLKDIPDSIMTLKGSAAFQKGAAQAATLKKAAYLEKFWKARYPELFKGSASSSAILPTGAPTSGISPGLLAGLGSAPSASLFSGPQSSFTGSPYAGFGGSAGISSLGSYGLISSPSPSPFTYVSPSVSVSPYASVSPFTYTSPSLGATSPSPGITSPSPSPPPDRPSPSPPPSPEPSTSPSIGQSTGTYMSFGQPTPPPIVPIGGGLGMPSGGYGGGYGSRGVYGWNVNNKIRDFGGEWLARHEAPEVPSGKQNAKNALDRLFGKTRGLSDKKVADMFRGKR